MENAVPFSLFYQEMQNLRAAMLEMHKSQRAAIEEGFENLGAKLEAHEKEDLVVANRVLLIEERQRVDKELKIEALDKANRRSTLISSVVAVGVTIAFKALDWFRASPLH
jgi:hypothetical protein